MFDKFRKIPTVADNKNFDCVTTRGIRHTLNLAKGVHCVPLLKHTILRLQGLNMIFHTLSFLMFSYVSAVVQGQCPPAEEIYPCKCKNVFSYFYLDCMDLKSIESLRRSLSAFKEKKDVIISLDNCSLGRIPSDLFSGIGVLSLTISNCNVDAFGEGGNYAFAGLENSLEYLWLKSSLKNNKVVNLSNLKSLEELHVSGNKNLTTLSDEWFSQGYCKLRKLYLDDNGFQTLGDNVFSNLTNVQSFRINGNSLTTLKRSMFPPVARLMEFLVLKNNQIEDLPSDLFTNMPALWEVELSNNNIRTLPKETWSQLFRQLNVLTILNNPLHCDYNIDWISDAGGPNQIYGYCSSPPERKGMALSRLIGKNKINSLASGT